MLQFPKQYSNVLKEYSLPCWRPGSRRFQLNTVDVFLLSGGILPGALAGCPTETLCRQVKEEQMGITKLTWGCQNSVLSVAHLTLSDAVSNTQIATMHSARLWPQWEVDKASPCCSVASQHSIRESMGIFSTSSSYSLLTAFLCTHGIPSIPDGQEGGALLNVVACLISCGFPANQQTHYQPVPSSSKLCTFQKAHLQIFPE